VLVIPHFTKMAALKASVAVPRIAFGQKSLRSNHTQRRPCATPLIPNCGMKQTNHENPSCPFGGNVHSAVHVFDAQLWDMKMMILDRIDSHANEAQLTSETLPGLVAYLMPNCGMMETLTGDQATRLNGTSNSP